MEALTYRGVKVLYGEKIRIKVKHWMLGYAEKGVSGVRK